MVSDEITVSIRGGCRDLRRVVDLDGDVLDMLVQKRMNTDAANQLFRALMRGRESVPLDTTTDKPGSYRSPEREVLRSVSHCRERYANNRAEVSHGHTRG